MTSSSVTSLLATIGWTGIRQTYLSFFKQLHYFYNYFNNYINWFTTSSQREMYIPLRCLNGNSEEQQPILGENRNQRDNKWRKFSYCLMGVIGVMLVVSLLLVFRFESRNDSLTTQSPVTILPTSTPRTASTVTTSTQRPSPPTSTTQRSSTSTTSNPKQLHFEMSEWRDGHCEGGGQCPCNWIETRFCQAINSGLTV